MYLVLALSSSVLFGIWQFSLGQFRGRLPREIIVLYSCITAAAVYLSLGLVSNELSFDSLDIYNGLLGGLLNVGGILFLLKAYESGKVGVVSGVAATSALIPLGYSFILGETLTTFSAIGLVVIIAGLTIFYAPAAMRRSADTTFSARAIVFALIAASFWGLAIIALDIGTRVSVTGTMFVSMLPQILVTLSIAFTAHKFRARLPGRSYAIIAGAGVSVALAQVAFYTAAGEGDIGVVAILGSLDPLVATLLALILLRERMSRFETTALLVVVLGTCLLAA